jgi:ribosome-binding protein aMBF1 (putative translation factor)
VERSVASRRLRKLQGVLRELRQEAGLRQVDLAAKLRRPQSFVSSFESGDRCLDVLELEQVCKSLGTTLGECVRRYERRG